MQLRRLVASAALFGVAVASLIVIQPSPSGAQESQPEAIVPGYVSASRSDFERPDGVYNIDQPIRLVRPAEGSPYAWGVNYNFRNGTGAQVNLQSDGRATFSINGGVLNAVAADGGECQVDSTRDHADCSIALDVRNDVDYILRLWVLSETADTPPNTWGAWVLSPTEGGETFIGSITVPSENGLLAGNVSNHVLHLGAEPDCAALTASRVVFGHASADFGEWTASQFTGSGEGPCAQRSTVVCGTRDCVHTLSAAQSLQRECASGRQWAFHAYVSSDDGLVLDMARLGVRRVVRAIEVPYVELAVKDAQGRKATYKGELTASPGDSSTEYGTALTTFECTPDLVRAGYLLRGPAGIEVRITQAYRFISEVKHDACEPSSSIPCARMAPSVDWQVLDADPMQGLTFDSFHVVQRFDYWPDELQGGAADIIRDRANLSRNIAVQVADTSREGIFSAINGGGRSPCGSRSSTACTWDNVHQAGDNSVELPGNTGDPGCPACVHMHWAWDLAANFRNSGFNFTSGAPAIYRGSPQTAKIALVREHLDRPGETDPVEQGFAALTSDRESMKQAHPILYWSSWSQGIVDGDAVYDATFPYRRQALEGDRGTAWTTPAEALDLGAAPGPNSFVVDPLYGEAREIAAGQWELPVRIRRNPRGGKDYNKDCRAGGRSGPYYLEVNTSAAGQDLLNADDNFRAAPVGLPYLQVRDRGQIVTRIDCDGLRVALVLPRRPALFPVSLRLLATR